MLYLTKKDHCILAGLLFTLSALALEFIALRLHIPTWGSLIAISGAFILGLAACRPISDASARVPGRASTSNCVVVVSFFIAFIAFVYRSGYVLPAHDPIAVPLLAKIVTFGKLSLDEFVRGSSAYSYPPGYPILFSPVMAFVPAVDAYFVFKVLNIATVALIPVTWAWMQKRLFPVPIQSWQTLLATYLVFFGIERTIGFALPFAGKNAVLLAILFAPLVIVMAVDGSRSNVGTMLAATATFGLILIHYTMLHMLAALLGSYTIFALFTKRILWVDALRIVFIGAIPAGLMLIFLHDALTDPRAGSFTFQPLHGLYALLSTILARNSFIVIYTDADFGISGFPYRGLALSACTVFSIAVAHITKLPNLGCGALVFFSAFVASLALALGVVPSGLAPDFARWFLWAIQAMVFAQAAVAALCLIHSAKSLFRTVLIGGVSIVALIAIAMMHSDSLVYANVNKSQKVTRDQLVQMQRTLIQASSGRECMIISDSTHIPEALVTIQPAKAWEYAESATTCRFMNGSWMQPGVAGGRDLGGFPSADVLKALPLQAALFFVGSEVRLRQYSQQLRDSGLQVAWDRIGVANSVPVWQRTPIRVHH
ncbi:hypothetical protein [Microvirga arabica]|uniref:hypothetical protein n=1 Tax=Microvirga arabica TaxID=1128671 RepID=UPI001939D45D|nr:hypothetical protein [Microvirga arabica]MBM1173048.1 hypothetical protein [Microvirga arabica]